MKSRLDELLGLSIPPIAIAFLAEAPAGLARVDRRGASSCSYWRRAADGESFYTEAGDHLGCAVGAHTHGVPTTPAQKGELMQLIETMVGLEYLSMDEVPQIPHRAPGAAGDFGVVAYAPLAAATFAPDVVLVRGDVRQLMLLAEAAQAAGVGSGAPTLGRPTCAVLPQALQSARGAASFGCVGNRVYTGASEGEGYYAIPGAALAAIETKLAVVTRANAELKKFHEARLRLDRDIDEEMSEQSIPVVDLGDYLAGGAPAQRFIEAVGRSMIDTGFFAVENHGVPAELTDAAYRTARRFFHMPSATKLSYERKGAKGQRGYTRFGTEHAKDSKAPDLKEFYQIGRTDVVDDHPVHAPYGPNIWPDAAVEEFQPTMVRLYQALDQLGATLLEACALYIDEPPRIFRDMCEEADTIVRVIYYPPVPADAPVGAIRSAAHEDINLITLLSGATSDGLELLRRDGSWLPIHAEHTHIVVDAGDMLQNVTNGLYKSTTHRVVNPSDSRAERFSMPCFIHPRKEVDLTPLASCVARTGESRFQSITAGDYLDQRLREIGLG